ncbi:MAG: EamA family transporter [Pseudomonadota bacterium]
MADHAILIVLVAAVLHATWNAIIKGAHDKIMTLAAISFGHVLVGGLLLLWYAAPALISWWFIIASTIIHYGYYAFLVKSYQMGDLSQVYPIARGIAPIGVALGSFVFADEDLGLWGWVAIGLVSGGIAMLGVTRWELLQGKTVLYALVSGVFIALYSVVDGLGIRLSGSPGGYIGWLFVLEITICLALGVRKYARACQIPAKTWLYSVAGGIISATAYGLVLYAKTLVPLAMVSALRESSVIIAAVIGVVLFGERPWKMRLFAACVVVCGIGVLATRS